MPKRKRTYLSVHNEDKMRQMISDGIPDDLKGESWVWTAIGLAAKQLVELQTGHWKLTLVKIRDEFGTDAFADDCSFICRLYNWQKAQEAERSFVSWKRARLLLDDAKGDSRNWRTTHIQEAVNDWEQDLTRRRQPPPGYSEAFPELLRKHSAKRKRTSEKTQQDEVTPKPSDQQFSERTNASASYAPSLSRTPSPFLSPMRYKAKSHSRHLSGVIEVHEPLSSKLEKVQKADEYVQNAIATSITEPSISATSKPAIQETDIVETSTSNLPIRPIAGCATSEQTAERPRSASISDDLLMSTSFSKETLGFLLQELLPRKIVQVFDPGDLPLGNDLSSWPSSNLTDIRDAHFVLVPLCMAARWILFIFDINQSQLTVLDSFKPDPDMGFLQSVSAKLGEVIRCAKGAQHVLSWTTHNEQWTQVKYPEVDDFGAQIFVYCLRMGAGDDLSRRHVDTSLWRAVLATLFSDGFRGGSMEAWLAERWSSREPNAPYYEPDWLAETLPQFIEHKRVLERARNLRARIRDALSTHLPDMEHLVGKLARVASGWLRSTLRHLADAEEVAADWKRQVNQLKVSALDESDNDPRASEDLDLIRAQMEAYYRNHRQSQVERLQKQKIEIEKIQGLYKQIASVIEQVRSQFVKAEKDAAKKIDDCRARIVQVGKADVDEGARKLVELEKELVQKKELLADAREYVTRCENGKIVV